MGLLSSILVDSITPSQPLSDGNTIVSEKENLYWVSSVLEVPRIVTWEFGTKASQFKLLFGLQTELAQSTIHLGF